MVPMLPAPFVERYGLRDCWHYSYLVVPNLRTVHCNVTLVILFSPLRDRAGPFFANFFLGGEAFWWDFWFCGFAEKLRGCAGERRFVILLGLHPRRLTVFRNHGGRAFQLRSPHADLTMSRIGRLRAGNGVCPGGGGAVRGLRAYRAMPRLSHAHRLPARLRRRSP